MVYPGMKTPLLAVLWACSAASQATEPESFWFRNVTTCGEARVTVRSYCEVAHRENAVMQRNTGCGEQQLVIERAGKKTVTRDLLEHEPMGDDYHIADSLRCVSAGRQRYLVINMSTGGSCDTCELQAVLDLDGRWKRYGDKWTASAAEQRDLRQSEPTWRKEPAVDLPNNVRESKQ